MDSEKFEVHHESVLERAPRLARHGAPPTGCFGEFCRGRNLREVLGDKRLFGDHGSTSTHVSVKIRNVIYWVFRARPSTGAGVW